MAEQIPFNIIADVLTKLGSSAIQEIGSVFGVAKELTKLTKKLDTIKGVLVDAEKRQEESDAVKSWVRRLKDVVYAADDLLDDFATYQLQRGGVARQVSNFFSSSNQLVFRFKMSDRLKDIKEEVDEIAKDIPILSLIQGNITHREVVSSWRETHSFVLASKIVGREENREKIIKSLVSSDNQENLSMVAIVGIGGLGKTTLAQLVYNDKEVVQYFERRLWVCVSDNFDVKSLVKKILKEVCEEGVEWLELNGLKNLLHEKLSQKRCLLVLDDVWNENSEKWDELKSLLMVVGEGSKILVTTRHLKVASIMEIKSPFVLEGLKETHSWDLFSKMAITQEPEKVNPKFVEIGKEIVNMCNGVPLVLKTMGTILHRNMEESYWLSIKNNKNLLSLSAGYDDVSSVRAGNQGVLSVLKLSYDCLPISLKQCFAYCALFPKDYVIEKKLLVQLWMAQGYIFNENKGYEHIEELLSRSLFEESEKDVSNNRLSCKMHDLIHDLAQSVIGSEALVLEDDDVKEISEGVHHVSLTKLMNLKLKALKVKHIRTFLSIAIDTGAEDDSIRSIDFSSFKCLRVLSLDKFSVTKVPKSLGKLGHLRYLDLSYNMFEVLPNSITRLKNLQTLKLVGCYKLKKLPQDIRELINLRHWENDEFSSHMPCGIGELTLLQSLQAFVVGNVGNGRGVGRLSELKGLNNLRGDLKIVKLENARDAVVRSGEAYLREKQYIQSLRLQWGNTGPKSGEDAELVMEVMQPHSNLKQLFVVGYGGGRFPSWMMNGGLSSMLPNLTTINLERCSRCHTLPCFSRLPRLKSLQLDDLEKVEYMVSSSEGPFFPSLEKLSLSRMPKLKELWKRRDSPPTHPPPSCLLLSHLEIRSCGALASLELHSSPLLSRIEITSCTQLTSLLLPPTPLLSQVDIKHCGNLASLELHSSPRLSRIKIASCPQLTSLLLPPAPLLSQLYIKCCDNLASLELHSSPRLSRIEITSCPQLTSLLLPPTPLSSQLQIDFCDNLASLELHSSPLLSRIEITSCPQLTSLLLPPSPLLSQLYIKCCDNLASLELHSSPRLSRIEIASCPQLTSLLLPPTPLLSQLQIDFCDNLASLELHSSPLLSRIEITSCTQLTSLLLPPTPLLSQVDIKHCDNLASLELHSSPLLSRMKIIWCPQLTSLLLPPTPFLSQLDVKNCGNLASLELHSSPRLSRIEITSCRKLTSLLLPPTLLLSELYIDHCVDLVSLELHSSPLLSSLEIEYCPKLTSLQLPSSPCVKELRLSEVKEGVLRETILLVTASSLESLSIRNIDDLMSLPDELHQHVSTLQTLKIKDCCHLATLPHWIGNLTSLTMLEIRNCPELTSLPQEMRSLTTLHTLSIDYSCGLALLPDWIGGLASLTDLKILSCPDLTSLPEELRSLRILKRLTICDWSGLTTLPDWIGSLSSLEYLHISKCPKLTSLPEEMRSLTTLKTFELFHCPHLSERCQMEQGQDRPKIAHVRYIIVDGKSRFRYDLL